MSQSSRQRETPARPEPPVQRDGWDRLVALATITGITNALVVDVIGVIRLPRPIDDFVRRYAIAVLLAIVVAGVSVLVWRARAPQGKKHRANSRTGKAARSQRFRSRLLLALSALSAVSTLTATALAVLIAFDSPLLPNTYSPTFGGPHDENLEVRLTAVEASDYLIVDDPATYSLGHLPPTSGAAAIVVALPVASVGAVTQPRYRIVLSVRNLQPAGVGMFIESVALHVVAVDRVPQPLRVWNRPATLHYAVNPFAATYAGQPAGTSIPANYVGAVPAGHVQLSPQESDELTIDVSGTADALVRYRVDLSYRLSDQLQERRLAVPLTFGVVFGEAVYWVRYLLNNGRLIPG